MTLVVCFANDQMPVLISDIMTSSTPNEYSQQNDPSVRRISSNTGFKEILYNFDYSQKIVKITDGFFVAWCGSVNAARKLCEYSRVAALQNQNTKRNYEELAHEIIEYRNLTLGPSGQNLQLMIVFDDEQDRNTKFLVEPDFTGDDDFGCNITSMGSGSVDFWRFIEQRGLTGPGDSRDVNIPGVGYLYDVLSFMTNAMSAQHSVGYGLENRWGLGMEVLVRKGEYFEKLDRIMTQSFTYKLGRNLKASNIAKLGANYQFYDNENLYVFKTHLGRPIGRYIVRSPDTNGAPRPLLSQYPRYPQMTVTLTSELAGRAPTFLFLEYNEAGDRSAYVKFDPFDQLDISYDLTRVRQLIRSKLKGELTRP